MVHDNAIEMATSQIRFGPGTTREVGMDLTDMGVRRVMLLIDPKLRNLPAAAALVESLERERIAFAQFDRIRVEPSDESFWEAIEFAKREPFDGFVALGGGSTMDTAKA